jgi:hypothetical protein
MEKIVLKMAQQPKSKQYSLSYSYKGKQQLWRWVLISQCGTRVLDHTDDFECPFSAKKPIKIGNKKYQVTAIEKQKEPGLDWFWVAYIKEVATCN